MGSVSAAISRQRQQSETKNTYSPDLEPTQQGYADSMYGNGAMIGSYGMSGGQFPTAGKDPAGFGSGGYGYPGQYQGSGSNSQGYQGAASPANTAGAFGAAAGRSVRLDTTGLADSARQGANRIFGGPDNGSYWGPGNTGQPGSGSLYNGGQGQPGGGGSTGTGAAQGYQFGPQQGGMGDYSAMQGGGQGGYQFGSQGAQGDLNATGGAAYGGYQNLNSAYGRLGRQGVTQGERSNLMAASNQAVQSNLASYRDQIANRAAQSGNTAGVAGAQARLGASSGQQLETADRANQTMIMQENQRRKEAGLAGQAGVAAGQAGLYGTGTGYMGNLLAGRGKLASLNQRSYTQGAGTGGTVSGSAQLGG